MPGWSTAASARASRISRARAEFVAMPGGTIFRTIARAVGVAREEEDAHAPLRQSALDHVRADDGAGSEESGDGGHGRGERIVLRLATTRYSETHFAW